MATAKKAPAKRKANLGKGSDKIRYNSNYRKPNTIYENGKAVWSLPEKKAPAPVKKATTAKKPTTVKKPTAKPSPTGTSGRLTNPAADRVQRTLGTGAYAKKDDAALKRSVYKQTDESYKRQGEIGKKLYGPSIFERHANARKAINDPKLARTASKKQVAEATRYSKKFQSSD